MQTGFIQANTNGRLHDASEPSLSPLDRGFLYGDAVYEVWRTYTGVLFGLDEHWERIEGSAAGLGLRLPINKEQLLVEIRRTITAATVATGWKGDHYVRLQVTRGAGPIGLDTDLAGPEAFWVLLVKPLADLTEAQLDAGLTVALATTVRRNDPRTLPPHLKTGNYLNNLLALREARATGAEEVLMVNLDGWLTEGSVRNFWFVEGDTACTPPAAEGLLLGVTRRLLFEQVGPVAGIKLAERRLRPEDLVRFTECFVSSTTQDIAPVAAIGTQRFQLGRQTLTRRLKQAFHSYVESYGATHTEFYVG